MQIGKKNYLQCISKSEFFFLTNILCSVLFFEFVSFGDCTREDLAIFGYRLQKKVGKFRKPTIFLPQSRTCCLLYTAISNFCPLILQPLWAFLSKKSLYICCCTGFFFWSPGCKTLIICKAFIFRFFIYTKIW